eukprot:TRINITY_DN92319_c0_g1_i1.p1 TRINITY_DN92319_c0_g1~~TRINITY_DN92319_c0_g1_i1.p1  ORF type:complete len:291 (+),score=53.33 TRINITY_DN92319_c0_g1_i1:72-944(+)
MSRIWPSSFLFLLAVCSCIASKILKVERTRKPVIWLHVHKAAGLWMCESAQKREKVVEPHMTCNYNDSYVDGIQMMGKHVNMDCKTRAKLFRDHGFTWGQIERHFSPADLDCHEAFLYGIMLREPMSMMESTANYNKFSNLDKLIPWLESASMNSLVEHPCGEGCKHVGHEELGWQVFDNFVTRSLNGLEGFEVPPRGLHQRHLEHAKQVIADLDVVMILERIREDVKQLRSVFGWTGLDVTKEIHSQRHSFLLQGTLMKSLYAINGFDRELYDFAFQMAQNRTNQLRSP